MSHFTFVLKVFVKAAHVENNLPILGFMILVYVALTALN